jgi:hypothetical protein
MTSPRPWSSTLPTRVWFISFLVLFQHKGPRGPGFVAGRAGVGVRVGANVGKAGLTGPPIF